MIKFILSMAFLLGALLLAARAHAAPPTTQPAVVIGIWQMDTAQLAEWKSLGVNTAWGEVDYGGKVTKAQYEQRLIDGKIFFITNPGKDVPAESRQPYRIGFAQKDEPDVSNHQGQSGFTLAEMKARYQLQRATGMPTYATFGSFDNAAYDGRKYRADIKKDRPYWHAAQDDGYFAQADYIGWDYYLWTTNRAGLFFIHDRLLDRVRDWGGDRPTVVFIETSTQGKGLPYGVADFEANVGHTLVYCAMHRVKLAGVCYFTHKVYPGWTSFDSTSPEVKASMKRINAQLLAYASDRVANVVPVAVPTSKSVKSATVQYDDGSTDVLKK